MIREVLLLLAPFVLLLKGVLVFATEESRYPMEEIKAEPSQVDDALVTHIQLIMKRLGQSVICAPGDEKNSEGNSQGI